jgi:hypothetical protein
MPWKRFPLQEISAMDVAQHSVLSFINWLEA